MKYSLLLLALAALSTRAADLAPLLAQPDQIVLENDFSEAGPVNKEHWGARQGTQWSVVDGVLRGKPSTPEYQAKKKDHFGYEPRVSCPVTPAQFIARFSVCFDGGSETAIVPFIEFGHHVCRIRLFKDGAEILADHESVKLAQTEDLRFEPGRWYHVLAEMKGEDFVVQFADGPTLHAKHASFAKAPESGGNGLGIAGPKDGTVEIDNVTLWSIKADEQPGWVARRDALPKFVPVEVGKKKTRKP
ncbi:MAG: hypothetical protein R3F13_00725 [Prosthecobacter sp.]